MNKKIVIDGRQLTGSMGGVQRYIREILAELDKIAEPGQYEILMPKGSNISVKYENIPLVEYGLFKGLVWEQISLPFYLLKKKCYGLFPCTIVPMLYPKGIAVVHDVMVASCPQLVDAFESSFAKNMLLLNYKAACKRADIVVTVSEFSKKDIMELYKTPEEKIGVVGNAWQHILRVEPEDTWKEKYPALKSGEFYFSLSANRKQKNFKWIYETAKRNPNVIFAMAGTQEKWQKQQEFDAPNILHLGYISDGEIRSLMAHCKAFLFPSIYEGFGIPPLEALASGAEIIIANSSCLPEIYGDSAHYIDPYDYDVDLDKLLSEKVVPAEKVLSKFGWDISARKIHEICRKLVEK